MSNRFRRIIAVTAAAVMLSAVLSTTGMAQTVSQTDSANAPVAVDVLLLRPAGFISLIVGTGLFLVSAPIVLVTRPHEIGKPFKQLVVRPAKYIWADPLGAH
jgi:hypothetical protein